MNKRLENKNIVVTAAGQGIGKATAIATNGVLTATVPVSICSEAL